MSNVDITTDYVNNFRDAKFDNMQLIIAVKELFHKSKEAGETYFNNIINEKNNKKFHLQNKIEDYKKCFEFFRDNMDAFNRTAFADQISTFAVVEKDEDFYDMLNAYITSSQASMGLDMVKLHKFLENSMIDGKLSEDVDSATAKTINVFKHYCYDHVSKNTQEGNPVLTFDKYVETLQKNNSSASNNGRKCDSENGDIA